jgi:NAD-dependent dihydropyrimidine dehydrogenase PreA subunit
MSDRPSLWSLLAEHWHLARHLRHLRIRYDATRCRGCWQCYQVCPVGCWAPDGARGVVRHRHPRRCVACGACVLQCPADAITLA